MADKLPWGMQNEGITPGSMKTISQNKLKAFSVGQMNLGKKLSKRAEEEHRKKAQEKEAAKVYEEFVASFEDTSNLAKTFVRGSTINTDEEKSEHKSGKLYRPSSKVSEAIIARKQREKEAAEIRAERERQDRPEFPKKKKEKEKSKSNLELFKEELKVIQQAREERHRQKRDKSSSSYHDSEDHHEMSQSSSSGDVRVPAGMEDYSYGSHDYGDPSTTNIFLGSINPKMDEEMLCEEFGKYGPLASVKIMWPRTDEERSRNRNCGFVAFMTRKDAERAIKALNGVEFMNYEMKLGWGKAVPIPPNPVYIPKAMLDLTIPPPQSGLPFNAQSKDKKTRQPPINPLVSEEDPEILKTLKDAVVKVVIPTERSLLLAIHRVIEFVVREGPMFEAMIMNRELETPLYRFLFDNKSPAHIYYRWKLYSILQGDSIGKWRTEDFRMFKIGSIWRPPPINPYTRGMPEELAPKPEPMKKGSLSDSQRDKLEEMLRGLTMERSKIAESMVFCLDHAESAEEIVECISESLSILETPIHKKLGRLFLISDILFNTNTKVANASYFRKFIEVKLPVIVVNLREAHVRIQQRLRAEQFKQKVMACFRSWDEWAIYQYDILVRLQNVFLGLMPMKGAEDEEGEDDEDIAEPQAPEILPPVVVEEESSDLDGAPLPYDDSMDGESLAEGNSDLDGMPLKDGGMDLDGMPLGVVEDYDGAPIKEEVDLDGTPISEHLKDKKPPGFKIAPSKWETVDASVLEAQAMTSSKWELLEKDEEGDEDEDGDDKETGGQDEDDAEGDWQEESPEHEVTSQDIPLKSTEMTEERRAKLREIEVKVMKFQDDLEAGRRSRKHGLTIQDQVSKYRAKLLQKEQEKDLEKQRDKEKERQREKKLDRVREFERARERERERLSHVSDDSADEAPPSRRERKRRRSRSGSPVGKRSHSPSRSPVSERRQIHSTPMDRSPLSIIREYSDSPIQKSRSGSPKRSSHARSRSSPKRSHRSRSRSPRRSRRSRSRSGSPHRSRRSRSKSPSRHSTSSHKKRRR
ncbi:U2 snRNP-associated SURP motif-containing protein-like [Asterias rubens]|uniref:U2 snRNP-associated SURP motif-containing protein-like n=1 Tax=Asterias rubens TaxID=7604 RepID=UPI001455AC63|nr:U2 snRNP-associated SURP motif-containing protein-like [Asterias rubens]